jgi:hypothetical protein
MMDSRKATRLKACRGCPHRVIRPGAGWDWPKCDGPSTALPSTALGASGAAGGNAELHDLSDAFLAGPDSNCPLGRWPSFAESPTLHSYGDGAASEGPDTAAGLQPAQETPASPHLSPLTPRHCLFASVAKCCARKFECRRTSDVVRVVTPDECNTSCARCVERLRIGAVITAWNEGAEVRRTVESLLASVSAETKLSVILVDDASKDGSCISPSPLRVVGGEDVLMRHEKPLGIGISRNEGWAMAQKLGCNVVSFHDAHMRFPEGALEALALRALQERCIVSAGSQPFKRKACPPAVERGHEDVKEGCRLWGCDLFYNANAGLQPKWLRMAKPPEDEWMRSPCIMGAGYVLSTETARELEGATSALWEDTAGRWGFSEQALSVKAFLLDIPIYFSRDHLIWHAFRGTNPLPKAGKEMWKNVARATYVLFGPALFDERFRAHCERQLTAAGVKEALAGAEPADAAWAHPPAEVFTHLCGKRAVVGEMHPDLDWTEHVVGKPERVIVWRPGEHLTWTREALPDAEIVCFEWSKHRFINWQAWCKEHKVALHQTEPLKDFVERPLALTLAQGSAQNAAAASRAGHDLALIAGDMQAECRAVAERLLREGGQIVVAPSQQDGQVADEFVKAEREQLKAAADPGPQPTTKDTKDTKDRKISGAESPRQAGDVVAVDPIPSIAGLHDLRDLRGEGRPLVTVCLLNYRRYENIGPILDCLAQQTVSCQVWLWNNGDVRIELAMGDGPKTPVSEHPIVSLVVDSNRNLGCFPRWPMLALSGTEFVATLDDDLMFKDDKVLADAVAACREECPDGIVGFEGWSEVPGRTYKQGRHHHGTTTGTRCDIIKGRFMLMRRALLQKVPLELPTASDGGPSDGLSHREDDIYVSLCVGGGRKDAHCIPARLGKRWKELPQHGTSMAGTVGHYDARDRAIKAIRAWLISRNEQRTA